MRTLNYLEQDWVNSVGSLRSHMTPEKMLAAFNDAGICYPQIRPLQGKLDTMIHAARNNIGTYFVPVKRLRLFAWLYKDDFDPDDIETANETLARAGFPSIDRWFSTEPLNEKLQIQRKYAQELYQQFRGIFHNPAFVQMESEYLISKASINWGDFNTSDILELMVMIHDLDVKYQDILRHTFISFGGPECDFVLSSLHSPDPVKRRLGHLYTTVLQTRCTLNRIRQDQSGLLQERIDIAEHEIFQLESPEEYDSQMRQINISDISSAPRWFQDKYTTWLNLPA